MEWVKSTRRCKFCYEGRQKRTTLMFSKVTEDTWAWFMCPVCDQP